MGDWRSDRIGSAIRGENPTVLARVPGGYAVIGDVQWLPGYCLLLTDVPEARVLSDLSTSSRRDFLDSMSALAKAVEDACRSVDPEFVRVNIEILGNSDPYLHAHIWPRYDWEPDEFKKKPVWLYPATNWSDPLTQLGATHDALRQRITAQLASALDPDALPIGEYAYPGPLRDRLIAAILDGSKTATSSLAQDWHEEGLPLPKVGDLEAVVDSAGQRVCITRNVKVTTAPLSDVSDEHAIREGEGFANAGEWRVAHESFWYSCHADDPEFQLSDSTSVVCVELEVVAHL